MSNSLDAPREFPPPFCECGVRFFFFQIFFFVVWPLLFAEWMCACVCDVYPERNRAEIYLVDCCCSKNFWNKTGGGSEMVQNSSVTGILQIRSANVKNIYYRQFKIAFPNNNCAQFWNFEVVRFFSFDELRETEVRSLPPQFIGRWFNDDRCAREKERDKERTSNERFFFPLSAIDGSRPTAHKILFHNSQDIEIFWRKGNFESCLAHFRKKSLLELRIATVPRTNSKVTQLGKYFDPIGKAPLSTANNEVGRWIFWRRGRREAFVSRHYATSTHFRKVRTYMFFKKNKKGILSLICGVENCHIFWQIDGPWHLAKVCSLFLAHPFWEIFFLYTPILRQSVCLYTPPLRQSFCLFTPPLRQSFCLLSPQKLYIGTSKIVPTPIKKDNAFLSLICRLRRW